MKWLNGAAVDVHEYDIAAFSWFTRKFTFSVDLHIGQANRSECCENPVI